MTQVVVATEGATTDGREIQGQWLEQAARNYDPEKYGARINCEHMRGVVPNGVFPAFGDVTALATGKNAEGKTTLLATLDPTDALKELVQQRQKVYTSCEIDPSFADTGEAYLVGLAVTDSPASLGTQMLKFSATLPDAEKPLSYMKKRPENLISETVEMPHEFSAVPKPESNEEPSILERVKHMLSRQKKKTVKLSADSEEVQEALELLAAENADLREELDKRASTEELNALRAQVEGFSSLETELTELKARLENEPAPQFSSHPPATGIESENVDY